MLEVYDRDEEKVIRVLTKVNMILETVGKYAGDLISNMM